MTPKSSAIEDASGRPFLERAGPLVAGVCGFAAILATQIFVGMRRNGGFFCYSLDDAYIHLTLARNLAFHGVWGMNPTAFASASSSPGWTVLLAAIVRLVGDRVWLPLVMNIVFALLLLWLVDATLRRWAPSGPAWVRVAAQAGLILLVPLPNLVLVGMEHCAQAFGAVLVMAMAAEVIVVRPPEKVPPLWIAGLLLGTFFLCAMRYESVFIVVPVMAMLLLRRRVGLMVAFAVCSALPPLLFGLYARAHGPFWLPFSVIAKASDDTNLRTLLRTAFNQWFRFGILLFAGPLFGMAALWVARSRERRWWERGQVGLVLAAVTCAAHLTLAPTGWLMRYEGYLFAMFVFALASALAVQWPLWRSHWRDRGQLRTALAVSILVAALVYPAMVERAWDGLLFPAEAIHDRYVAHIQPALFISKYYPDATIVANDIGAITYYSNAKVLDLIGLGSVNPHLYRLQKRRFTKQDMDAWAKREGATIAVLQYDWPPVAEVTPASWPEVEQWDYPRDVVFPGREVGFYAVDPSEAPMLRQRLDSFSLPNEITRSK